MTSQKQVEANRKNAKHSTGPRSKQGKALVALNATRHGILSEQVPVDEGEQEEYFDFHEAMVLELDPRGGLESLMVDRIISTAWRLRRVVHVESLMLCKSKGEVFGDGTYRKVFEGNSANNMAVLSRYERSLENALFRALKEFRGLREEPQVDLFDLPLA